VTAKKEKREEERAARANEMKDKGKQDDPILFFTSLTISY